MENKTLKKIMLVDDDYAAHTFHKIMIEEADLGDISVEECFSVDEALDQLKSCIKTDGETDLPQVILVDLNMPRKSGWDFVEEVKQLDLKGFFPHIYLVTNSENPADISKVNSMKEIVGFMPKFLESGFFVELSNSFARRRAS